MNVKCVVLLMLWNGKSKKQEAYKITCLIIQELHKRYFYVKAITGGMGGCI